MKLIEEQMHKFVDIKEVFVNYHRWDGELLFRGVVACKHKAVVNTSRLNGVPLSLMAGEMIMYTIGHWLKIIIAVLCGSSTNSLASNEGGHLLQIYFLFGSQKQLVWASSLLLPKLLLFN